MAHVTQRAVVASYASRPAFPYTFHALRQRPRYSHAKMAYTPCAGGAGGAAAEALRREAMPQAFERHAEAHEVQCARRVPCAQAPAYDAEAMPADAGAQ